MTEYFKNGDEFLSIIPTSLIGKLRNARGFVRIQKVKLICHVGGKQDRRAASPLVRLVEGEERCEALTTPRCPSSKLEWKRAKSYCHLFVLKATANDRRHLALCHDEFRGFRSGLCRSSGISNNNNNNRSNF
ncbi:hypothetical protein TNCV_4909421 [Trichonephila clavipes]|uniref:Uncharacterized protein n=1 Tax=Trichonephila clavipes TaxID=2585209 RepID=A0A8X6RT36_TRICX|nr:hypothetical protein TNCV_4909421 [Trichonephila clavipes]